MESICGARKKCITLKKVNGFVNKCVGCVGITGWVQNRIETEMETAN